MSDTPRTDAATLEVMQIRADGDHYFGAVRRHVACQLERELAAAKHDIARQIEALSAAVQDILKLKDENTKLRAEVERLNKYLSSIGASIGKEG